MYDSISKEDIKQALEKIRSSSKFSRSPILSKFLQFIVLNTIDGHTNQIKEYTVGFKVLNKPHTFNPQLDASVRIHAVRLRKLLTEYYQTEGIDATIRIEIPKGRYTPTFSNNTNSHLETSLSTPSAEIIKEDSICILPFTGFIQHPSFDFSVIGFCEFLSEKLSLFQDIKVVSFYSASRFMQEGGSVEHIGKELGVSYYLTGSIELDDEQLRVSYQLIEAATNAFIWSHQTEASLLSSEVMEAADNISNQIVASLAGYSGFIHYSKILDRYHEPPLNNKMANAIFWFYHYQVHHTKALFYEAIQKLEKVVAEDENCALCWAVLAHLYGDALIYNYHTDKNPLETAQAYVAKALEHDEYCQHAHLANAWVQILLRNKKEILASLKKVDTINPNSSMVKAMCALGLSLAGDYDESLAYLKKAKQLHPLPYWWMSVPEILVALKNNAYDKVIFLARKSGTPSVIFEHIFEMIGLYYLGDNKSLLHVLPLYKKKFPDGIAFVQNALPAILLDDEVAEKIKKALQEIGNMQSATNNGS
jgi:adenylate cyclase